MKVTAAPLQRSFYNKSFSRYIMLFGISYALLYVMVLTFKALADPIGYYSSFFDRYFDLVGAFGSGLLFLAKGLLVLAGYTVKEEPGMVLRLNSGVGIQLYFECMGFKIICFWTAFVLANRGGLSFKALWIAGGMLGICLVNAVRMDMVLMAIEYRWPKLLHLDHHDWFNVCAYALVFAMIYLYDRAGKKNRTTV